MYARIILVSDSSLMRDRPVKKARKEEKKIMPTATAEVCA
jgi:hypothetical protein